MSRLNRMVVSTINSDMSLERYRLGSLMLMTSGVFFSSFGYALQIARGFYMPLLSAPLFLVGVCLIVIGIDRYRRWQWLTERYVIAPGIPVELAFKRKPGEPLDPGFFKLASVEERPEHIEGVRIPDPGPVGVSGAQDGDGYTSFRPAST